MFRLTYETGQIVPREEIPAIRAMRGEIVRDAELIWHTPAGDFSLLVDSAKVPSPSGQPSHAAIIFRDVSRIKEIQAELQRRNRELALLNRVIAASVTETEPEAILQITCRELSLAFDIPHADAALLSPEKTEARVFVGTPAEGGAGAAIEAVSVVGDPLFEYLARHRAPLVLTGDEGDPETAAVRASIRLRGAASLLVIPLVIEGEVVGCLKLYPAAPRELSSKEIDVAFSVASQAAGVLARLRLEQARRDLEAKYHLAQKVEAVGRLTGGVAHDFNNILTVILGSCSVILDALDQTSHPLRQEIEQIQTAAERAASLTHQLLLFSRQQVLLPTVLNVNDIVISVEKMLARLIGEDITLVTRLAPELGRVKADPGQISQILMNLAVNARDAMPQGGRLTITTANEGLGRADAREPLGVTPGSYVMLTVRDTGMGMPPEVKARIFEPFFTTKAPGKGTGLGLSTCYGIVKQHGGHIVLESEVDRGTAVKVYLPQTTESYDARHAAALPAAVRGGDETVLLVEDEAMVRRLAARVLRNIGYKVLEAVNGIEALRIVGEHAGGIDLLLTDVVMPYLSGIGLAERVRKTCPRLKVLFISGYSEKTTVESDMLNAGAGLLQKPFTPESLARKVRDILAPT